MTTVSKLSYCGAQVRRLDHDRYVTALFVPRAVREHVFALYAFNSEIARTRDVVSEAPLGAIRLQWWREAIAEIHAGKPPRAQPIVEALCAAIRARPLSPAHFETLIAAREADLEHATPANLAELEQFAERTSGPLVCLVAETLGTSGPQVQPAARHTGTAWALTGLLRAVPYHARNRLLYLPADLLDRNRVDRRDLFELRPTAGLAPVVQTIADRARELLHTARVKQSSVPPQARTALLSATAAAAYLDALRRLHHDVFAMPRSLPSLATRLAWARLRRWY